MKNRSVIRSKKNQTNKKNEKTRANYEQLEDFLLRSGTR